MSEKVPLKGSRCEVNFRYTAKMEGYTNSNSDIPKLAGIAVVTNIIHRCEEIEYLMIYTIININIKHLLEIISHGGL